MPRHEAYPPARGRTGAARSAGPGHAVDAPGRRAAADRCRGSGRSVGAALLPGARPDAPRTGVAATRAAVARATLQRGRFAAGALDAPDPGPGGAPGAAGARPAAGVPDRRRRPLA